MDIETRKTYDKIFETLNTEGWGLIQTRLVDMFNQQNNVLNIPDEVDQIEQQEEDDEND